MIFNILKTLLFYFVLMYLSTNLLGLFIRSIFSNPELDRLKQVGHELIKREVEKSQRAEKWVNITALIFIIVYFYLLFYFWNIGVVVAAIIIMAGRLPDLLWEIKHGKRVNPQLMGKNALYYLISFLPWLALSVLYFSLY